MSPELRERTAERILAACLALAAAGCTGFAAPVRKSDAPAPAAAYVYGRFSIDLHGWTMPIFESSIRSAGLRLKCEGGEDVLIGFTDIAALEAFQVAPGRCVLAELSFRNWAGVLIGAKPTHAAAQTLELAGGKAYYIGDWHVDVQTHKDFSSHLLHSNSQWTANDAFEQATRDLRERYPRLSALPVEDALPSPLDFAFFHYESRYFNVPPPTYPVWRR